MARQTGRHPQGVGRREFLHRAAAGAVLGGLLSPSELLGFLTSSARQARAFEILVLGDSIMWGQGLKDEQKFSHRVESWIRGQLPGIEVHRHVLAHSGAQIRANAAEDAKPPTHGEVPNHYPSIQAQLATAQNATLPLHAPLDPRTVSLVLLDGGINDFGTKKILSPDPTIGRAWVREHTRKLCVDRMKELLPDVAASFPNAKIVVTNYFQIVSDKSDMAVVWDLLEFWDIVGSAANVTLGPLREKLSDQSLAFHEESTRGLREAVSETNGMLAANDKPTMTVRATARGNLTARAPGRVAFAEVPFGPQHAYGASDTYLFYLNEPDPAAAIRKPMCQQQVPNASPLYPNCLLAAAGHPNIRGARAYADAIVGVLGRWLPEWQGSFGVTPPKTERAPAILRRP